MALLRGTLISFDNATYLADVRLDGSPWQSLTGVKTARNIPSAEMLATRPLLIDTGDLADASDAIVVAVWE